MRTLILANLAIVVCSSCLMAGSAFADQKSVTPTQEQLDAAIEAFGKHGGMLATGTDPQTKRTTRIFNLPSKTTDADLKGLPNLPFLFGLDLPDTKVTDAGIKELKNLQNLDSLWLTDTKVTDAV
jgi:internalin A